jgi:hypothetical protein
MSEGIKQLVMTWQSSTGQYTGNVKNIAVSLKKSTDINTIDTQTSNDIIYNLQGQRITGQPHPGIYIVGGRKVIIK